MQERRCVMAAQVRSRGDVCYKCGETRGAIYDGPLICWDGYDELGKHQFVMTAEELAAYATEPTS